MAIEDHSVRRHAVEVRREMFLSRLGVLEQDSEIPVTKVVDENEDDVGPPESFGVVIGIESPGDFQAIRSPVVVAVGIVGVGPVHLLFLLVAQEISVAVLVRGRSTGNRQEENEKQGASHRMRGQAVSSCYESGVVRQGDIAEIL